MSAIKSKVRKRPSLQFPTTAESYQVKCPVCGETAEATVVVVTVPMANMPSSAWLQMPPGWAHSMPFTWYECRGLATGLARCPNCIPQPNGVEPNVPTTTGPEPTKPRSTSRHR